MRLAVIDLGSNTFHLLIVEKVVGDLYFKKIYKERVYTFLSKGGLGKINDESYDSALSAITSFKQTIGKYEVNFLKVIGTEALRKATNSPALKMDIEKILGDTVEIVSGDREASLIYKGVMISREMHTGSKLIMDIGGGSTEFGFVVDGKLLWSQSYTLGISHLFSMFKHSDPITLGEIGQIKEYIRTQLGFGFYNAKDAYKPDTLVGASGSYEVLLSLNGVDIDIQKAVEIKLPDFHEIKEKIFSSTLDQRLQMEGLPKERAKLVVMAFILKETVIEDCNFETILFSPYSLKDGVIVEWMNDNN
jgi:exopolyphosphatase/guanosine-5'-triphosphate,3'-diphosphate pyrophosphatase